MHRGHQALHAIQYIYSLDQSSLFYRNKPSNNHQNVSTQEASIETLLMQVEKLEEKNKKTLKDKKVLEQQNEKLRKKITLQAKLQAKLQANVIKLSRDKQKQEIVLRKICTPGQIARLTSSTNSRKRWSPEDIVSAISLRALSPKAYRYLRNIMKVPLPCFNF